jgi:hypothetical protein
MSTQAANTKIWWLYTLISLVGTILFLIFLPEWFWVMLPFLGTALVKALDWM